MGIQMSRKSGFEFEDLEDDAIYELFKFLDIKGVVRFERLNQRIRELNLSLERCRTTALAFGRPTRNTFGFSRFWFHYNCGVSSHRPIKSSIIRNVSQILEICKKFPKTCALYFSRSVEGDAKMGQEIGRACPKIEHIYFDDPASEAMVRGILRGTVVTHLSTHFDCRNFNYDTMLSLCPNLTYFKLGRFHKSRIAELYNKLKALEIGYFTTNLVDLAPRFTSVKCLIADGHIAIAHNMDKLESLGYIDFGGPFNAPEVQKFPNLKHLEINSENHAYGILSYFVTANHRIQSIKTQLWSNPNTVALINENCPKLEYLEITFSWRTVDFRLPLEGLGKIKHLKRLVITCLNWEVMEKTLEHISELKMDVDVLVLNDVAVLPETNPLEEAKDLKKLIEKLAIGNERTKIKTIIQFDKQFFNIIKESKRPNLMAGFVGY